MRTIHGKQSHAKILAQAYGIVYRFLLDVGCYSSLLDIFSTQTISLIPRMATDKTVPVAYWITLAIKNHSSRDMQVIKSCCRRRALIEYP